MLKKAIFRNSAVNALGKAFNYAVQLLLIAYIVRHIGGEAYGVFVIALALIGNSNLLEAGFGLAATKYVAECKARGDSAGIDRVVNTGFLVNTVLAILFAAAILTVSFFFLGFFFNLPPDRLSEVRRLMFVLVGLSFFEFWTVGFIRVAEGLQNYVLARGMENIKWGLRFAFTATAFWFKAELSSLGIAYLAAGVIDFSVLAYFIYGRGIKFSLFLADRETFRRMFSFSVWIMISKISALFFYRINSIIIGIFLEPVYAAYYSVGSKIYELLRYGFSIISSTLVPVSAELYARKDTVRLRILFEKATYYTVLLMTPFIAFTVSRAQDLVLLWMGPEFLAAAPLTSLLALSLVPTLLVAAGTEMLVGMGQVRYLVIYGIAGSAVAFATSLFLIGSIGINAVAYGAIAGSAVTSAGYLFRMMRSFEFSCSDGYMKDGIVRSLPFILLLCGVLCYSGGLLAGAGFSALYLGTAFFFLVDRSDRDYFLRALKGQS